MRHLNSSIANGLSSSCPWANSRPVASFTKGEANDGAGARPAQKRNRVHYNNNPCSKRAAGGGGPGAGESGVTRAAPARTINPRELTPIRELKAGRGVEPGAGTAAEIENGIGGESECGTELEARASQRPKSGTAPESARADSNKRSDEAQRRSLRRRRGREGRKCSGRVRIDQESHSDLRVELVQHLYSNQPWSWIAVTSSYACWTVLNIPFEFFRRQLRPREDRCVSSTDIGVKPNLGPASNSDHGTDPGYESGRVIDPSDSFMLHFDPGYIFYYVTGFWLSILLPVLFSI
ncbi:hypothetical protein EVAR_38756_1 [Eumeta japonica]|uniref:Uncharacterized protein n=1 Tax=Eumeta variegata TaxID=151549 RepID=A0A4C1WLI6_EUMVA|nr:hypothetical protein EVAR_38756_1 [Eumeta japonica]